MTTTQLNRDIAKLAKRSPNRTNDKEMQEFRDEFMRLYRADQKFEYMNAKSIRWMFRMNQRYCIEPFHTFGIFIDLPNGK